MTPEAQPGQPLTGATRLASGAFTILLSMPTTAMAVCSASRAPLRRRVSIRRRGLTVLALVADAAAQHPGGGHARRHAGHDAGHHCVDIPGHDRSQVPLRLRCLNGRDALLLTRCLAHVPSLTRERSSQAEPAHQPPART